MIRSLCPIALACLVATTWLSTSARADLAAPGDYQLANGGASDWDPGSAPILADVGGGVYQLQLTGLAGAGEFSRFQFKVLDDEGTGPAAWGDPEVPNNGGGSPNNWFFTDASGNAEFTIDRNVYADGFLPAQDRMTSSIDVPLLTAFYAVGDWMDEAGGAGDWNPADAMFQLADQGGGMYSLDAVISTPGSYQFKVTGGSWDYQWGTNGRLVDAANWAFDTTAPNQTVTFAFNAAGAISVAVVPEPTSLFVALCGVATLATRRRR
ncbi:MAG: hypothetical protein KDA61_20450 [Planctomycetales bacterium]|nr:hypothetical protein [Planctomycetales bacterium]